jgi:hypothetical protein
MAGRLKVYSWQGYRASASRASASGSGATREIVAAKSKADAARLAGEDHPRRMFNLHETGNDVEIQVALARPGVVHWVAMSGPDDYRSSRDPSVWKS